MPVEEGVNIDLGTNEKTFDELDRAAAKAIKTLEKRNSELKKSISTASKAEHEQKRLEKRGGIFAGKDDKIPSSGKAPRDLAQSSKQDEYIEKRLRKLDEQNKKRDIEQFGKKESPLENILGKKNAKNLVSAGKNPKAFVFGALKALPVLGGVLAAKDIAEFIVNEIAKIDRFFKKFIDEIDNRIDSFRSLQEQANIQAGIAQRIITTASGSTEPRFSYNTFEQFNNNQIEHEEKFQMTNNSGAE